MSSNSSIKFIFILSILLNLAYCGIVEFIKEDSKYENNEYIQLFKIPIDIMEYSTNAGEISPLSCAFDNNNNSRWISKGSYGAEYFEYKTNTKYESLMPNITITFKTKVSINRMVYQAYSNDKCINGLGYPILLKIYYKNRDNQGNLILNDKDFILGDTIISNPTGNKVIFYFDKIISCDQIKIEFKEINFCDYNNFEKVVSANEIVFLNPETDNVNENIMNAFNKSDYRELTLSNEYQNDNKIKLLKYELNNFNFSSNLKKYIERIIGVSNGSIVYDPRREFTTNPKAKINRLYQRGDVEKYSQNILKMANGGTNRQLTGVFAKSNETITIYASFDENERLPCLRFTQYIGAFKNWFGNNYCLTKRKDPFRVTDFKVDSKDYTIPTFPGGPIYLTNPYTPEEQRQNIKIYIDGGTLFPILRVDEDENNYLEYLDNYVKFVNENNLTNPDITELYSNRVMITVRATQAYEIYRDVNKRPIDNLINWDNYIKKLFIYDGIQFEKNQPYYDEKNNYICFHLKYSQPYGLAYASSEHIGIFYDDWLEKAIYIVEKEIGWGFPHEIGHMMDINERTVSETSNNMISKFSETYLQGDGSWGMDRQNNKIKYLTRDDIDDRLRGCSLEDQSQCEGFLKNIKLNYLIWWDLESMFHGYWGKLDNMYRYNSTLSTGLTKIEKFVYFTNLILGMDLGYYFTRWGFALNGYFRTFNESDISSSYKKLMNEATIEGLIDKNIPQKKFWYVDYKQYNYMNDIGLGCYEDPDEYNIEINHLTNYGIAGILIEINKVRCPGHLGFEIYESDRLIGFTFDTIFVDDNKYKEGYTKKYKVIAYDRLLFASKPSPYLTLEDDYFLFGVGNIFN